MDVDTKKAHMPKTKEEKRAQIRAKTERRHCHGRGHEEGPHAEDQGGEAGADSGQDRKASLPWTWTRRRPTCRRPRRRSGRRFGPRPKGVIAMDVDTKKAHMPKTKEEKR